MTCISASAKVNTTNAAEAKKLFDKVYNMVFGKDGSTLSYNVNIIGVFKTQGTIYYKGKKQAFEDKRIASWSDGITAYKVDKKEKIVHIYRADDDERDKRMAKFKFDASNFSYSYKTSGNNYEITAKVKNPDFFGIKHVTIVVNKANLYPSSLKIKLGVFSTTVKISNFKAGNINDAVFVYPKNRFSGFKVEDHR